MQSGIAVKGQDWSSKVPPFSYHCAKINRLCSDKQHYLKSEYGLLDKLKDVLAVPIVSARFLFSHI